MSEPSAPAPTSPPPATPPRRGALLRAAQAGWRGFCRGVVAVFYRRVEIDGGERIPATGPLLLCANHADALADAVLVQARMPRPVHPLARSGLFGNPLLRFLLAVQQAVPIYRRQDAGSDTSRNEDTFARCYEILAAGEALLIFPEGQSHSDPRLRPLKTGAARIAVGARERNGSAPVVLPLGLTFSRKGHFRSSVLLRIGDPVDVTPLADEAPDATARRVTEGLEAGLRAVTLNVDSWAEFDLLRRVQRFFAFRRGRRAYRRSLAHRLRALQHLQDAVAWIRGQAPAEVEVLSRRLARFERLCNRYGIDDYQLTVRYSPAVVLRFLARTSAFALFLLPLALWAVANSYVPYTLTGPIALAMSRGRDQYDTAKILVGMMLFAIFWGGQTATIFFAWGTVAALVYAASLPATAAVALVLGRERERVFESVRVFVAFARRGALRRYLLARRRELEVDIAKLMRGAKREHHARLRSAGDADTRAATSSGEPPDGGVAVSP